MLTDVLPEKEDQAAVRDFLLFLPMKSRDTLKSGLIRESDVRAVCERSHLKTDVVRVIQTDIAVFYSPDSVNGFTVRFIRSGAVIEEFAVSSHASITLPHIPDVKWWITDGGIRLPPGHLATITMNATFLAEP